MSHPPLAPSTLSRHMSNPGKGNRTPCPTDPHWANQQQSTDATSVINFRRSVRPQAKTATIVSVASSRPLLPAKIDEHAGGTSVRMAMSLRQVPWAGDARATGSTLAHTATWPVFVRLRIGVAQSRRSGRPMYGFARTVVPSTWRALAGLAALSSRLASRKQKVLAARVSRLLALQRIQEVRATLQQTRYTPPDDGTHGTRLRANTLPPSLSKLTSDKTSEV